MAGRDVAPRTAAFGVLRDVSAGAYADRAAARRFETLSPRDRRLAQELAYGTIRLRARLDAELSTLSTRPLDQLDAAVLDALRLGLYQVRETRIPAHAAVNETMDAVRGQVSRSARGFLNAVLRRAVRGEPDSGVFGDLDEDPVRYLATWGSHPEWLVRRWLDRWPLAAVRRLIENDNRPPPVTLRLLNDTVSPEDWERFAAVGLERLAGLPHMARLTGGAPAEAMRRAHAIAQDPAASCVVDYVSDNLDGPVLDACAAPGGKTMGLWHASSARPLIAADISLERLLQVRQAAQDTGAEPALLVMDARFPAIRSARTVLLDVPCSGTGVLRRRPDARWRITAGRIEALVARQREMIEAAAALVEPGGVLVYATCSLEPEENEQQVEWFVARHPEFERDKEGQARGTDLFVAPWEHESDGAFASRLRKRRNG
ncbi:MAG: 16S rRNA (cytosine(967)-C(5))-methyltransferase RsmB [Gemmatimonadota bacterium]|nr:16S rRNA (cytosine(967)-C(5))-methyltransferase RsmB [Gemmatimonadota bacterium]MDH3426943.1 16S rRNA (cytosine(967)-C(5))-methyltransferase RsmB [Gemmatimonadota bacterium]